MGRTLLALLVLAIACEARCDEPIRLVSAAEHRRYELLLPLTDDEILESLAQGPLTFFTDKEMPRPQAAPRATKYGPAPIDLNKEFPWNAPAGTDRSLNVKGVKFVRFPDDGAKIQWWTDAGGMRRWVYPVGTVFGEILTVNREGKWDFTFEVRTRSRGRDGWHPNLYRPFLNHEELDKRIREFEPAWMWHDQLARLSVGPRMGEVVRRANDHRVTVFSRAAYRRELPTIPYDVVERLLTETPFQSALGQHWSKSVDGEECYAPTTRAAFHIVPQGYEGHYLEVSRAKCMTCHNEAGTDGIRGGDGILSFSPIDAAGNPRKELAAVMRRVR